MSGLREADLCTELAELKLQNALLSHRLDMMTRMVTNADAKRANFYHQLIEHGFMLDTDNNIIKGLT